MKLAYAALAAASLATLSQPAVAQQAQAPSAQQMAPVSDAELENFVIAASMIGQIQRSEEIAGAEKEKAAMQVLSQAQMTPQRFNTIGAALQTSETLQARVDQTLARLKKEQAEG
ncbi:DUF4168 domain-containing protein [Citromicrobium sp. JLT1363]|uniref:DUF4168 domain-containing protein n=1 Tax=Citromicrobium sp. JLT1363 TaxID=517722 RepID=UPI0002E66051|nr:DUF4168 domain-containing protein [Citromicrobium sp. JLT1363]